MLTESRLRKLAGLSLREDRDSELTYTNKEVKGKIERVTVVLEGKKSEKMTKLAKRFKELNTELLMLKEKEEALKSEAKEAVASLFDAQDVIFTRVVETVSLTLSISKSAPGEDKVDTDKVIAKLLELMPELTDKVKDLQSEFTIPGKSRAPSLGVKMTEGAGDWVASMIKKAKSLISSLTSWGASYDKKLDAIKEMMTMKESVELKKYVVFYSVGKDKEGRAGDKLKLDAKSEGDAKKQAKEILTKQFRDERGYKIRDAQLA